MRRGKQLQVLLIEDDLEDAEIFRSHAAASTAYGLKVDHVLSCEQARQKLSETDYDIIFLDHRSDEATTGLDLLQGLRAEGVETPVYHSHWHERRAGRRRHDEGWRH